MKNSLLSIVFLTLSSGVACQPSHFPHEKSGIDFRLRAAEGGPSEARPDGILHVQGLDNGVSLHVPLSPADPHVDEHRLRLPPGAYSFTYLPVTLDGTLGSLRRREAAAIVSRNPFVRVVAEGRFETVDVRMLAGVPQELPRASSPAIAAR
jgi:hypothetical protein